MSEKQPDIQRYLMWQITVFSFHKIDNMTDGHTPTYGQTVNITIQLECNTYKNALCISYVFPCIFFIISVQLLKLYTKYYTVLEMVCYLCIELIIYMWPLLHQWKTRFNCKVFKYEFDFVFSPFSLNTLRALAYFH